MSKEEFVKLLETLDFEELRCATISYYKNKPKRTTSYWENTEDYNPKTICIGTDLEKLISENNEYQSRRIMDLSRDVEKIMEKMANE